MTGGGSMGGAGGGGGGASSSNIAADRQSSIHATIAHLQVSPAVVYLKKDDRYIG